jgi:hypothetical protein
MMLIMHAALSGVALSAALFALTLATIRLNPEILLNDYPPDVRAKFGPISSRAKTQRLFVSLLYFAVLVLATRFAANDLSSHIPSFRYRDAFVYALVMLQTFNLLDWLVLDTALVSFQPTWAVLPGTAGLAGYRDYAFHFKGWVVGLFASTMAAAIIGGGMVWMG